MDDPTIYRQYAEECGRLARSMSPADRKVMLEIAEAWLACAKEAEKKKGLAVIQSKHKQTAVLCEFLIGSLYS